MVHARAAMVSALIGKEVTTCMTDNCHITYDLGAMSKVNSLLAVTSFDGTDLSVPIRGIYPYVSGSLLLGTITLDSPAVRHLAPLQRLETDEYGVVSKYDAIKLANMYRLFGNEVTLLNDASKAEIPWFTNVRECIVCPTDAVNGLREYDKVELAFSNRRLGRGTSLPDVSSLRPGDSVVMTVTAPNIHIMMWRSRSVEVRPYINIQRQRATIQYKVKAKTVVSEATFGIRYRPVEVKKGFRRDEPVLAPEYPVATARPAAMPPPEDQEEQEAVDVIE
jgi:hypothetical protein